MSKSGEKQACACGHALRRKFSPTSFIMARNGRDDILATLNQEEGAQTFPASTQAQIDRYSQAMAKGLDPPKPTIGRGF